MSDERELVRLASEIAREAGELARVRRAQGVHLAATKSSLADIVTAADREVEELIRARLAEQRPGDGFLGEESGADSGETGITWVVDPIDGDVYKRQLPGRIVDTVGAGDATLAAVVAGLAAGEHDWPALLHRAMEVAAATCRAEGGLLRTPESLADAERGVHGS